MVSLSVGFALLSLAVSAFPKTKAERINRQALNIVNAVRNPDGFPRNVTTANALIPGPLISGKMGDRFLINVSDNLVNQNLHRSTSIHWHGMFQNGSTEMDGAALVSQCPLVPGNSFLYNFSVPTEAGTYWYHSHVGTQYCDGLNGPMVIYDDNDMYNDMYDVDNEETVIVIQDWYHNLSTSLFTPTNKPRVEPDSMLINGKGRYPGGPNATTNDLSVITVDRGLSYRFRIVNTGCSAAFDVQFDNHSMTVIEADGVEVVPVENVNKITVFAGQRYSVVVHATNPVFSRNPLEANYWFRAYPTGTNNFTNHQNLAVLRYRGALNRFPTTTITSTGKNLTETDLHPAKNPGAPGPRSLNDTSLVQVPVNIGFSNGNWTINGFHYDSPPSPVLLQILNGADPSKLLPTGAVYNISQRAVVQVTLQGGGNHPFHLHGHTFDVIQAPNSNATNYINPVRRDVISTGNGPTPVIFRFVADNPGPWFLHCHIDWHLAGGLALVFAELPGEIPKHNPIKQDWFNLCNAWDASNPDIGKIV